MFCLYFCLNSACDISRLGADILIGAIPFRGLHSNWTVCRILSRGAHTLSRDLMNQNYPLKESLEWGLSKDIATQISELQFAQTPEYTKYNYNNNPKEVYICQGSSPDTSLPGGKLVFFVVTNDNFLNANDVTNVFKSVAAAIGKISREQPDFTANEMRSVAIELPPFLTKKQFYYYFIR